MKNRIFVAMVIASGVLLGQVGAPLLGYLRDSEGRWRPVHGSPGAFSIGAPANEVDQPVNRTAVRIDGNEVTVGEQNVRLRIPRAVTRVEPMGESWYVLKTDDGAMALRTEVGKEALYELPAVPE